MNGSSGTVSLFPAGLPVGTELLVILLISLVGFVPLVALLVGTYLFDKKRGKAEALAREESVDDR